MDYLCYLCLLFVRHLGLYVAALCSPAKKGLTFWLSFVMFNCIFVISLCGILSQVWYLIVSIPDLCCFSYLYLGPFTHQLKSNKHFRLEFTLSTLIAALFTIFKDNV